MAKKKSKKKPPPKAPEPKSRANLVMVIIVVVLIAGGGVLVWQLNKPKPKVQIADEGRTALCAAIQTFDMPDRNHVEPNKVQYQQDPPVGGNHWGSPPPVDDGFYESPIQPESLVHNLEHGQVVVYYAAGDADLASKLKAYTNERAGFLVVVPRQEPLAGGGKVAFTAWGKSQICTGFDKEALTNFQSAFKNQGPEKVRVG